MISIIRLFTFPALFAMTALLAGCENGTPAKDEENAIAVDDTLARIQAISEEIMADPTAALYIKRARLYDAQGDLELAVRDVETATELDSLNPDYIFYLGELYEERPYFGGAIGAYEHVLQLEPQNTEAMLRLGELYFKVKDRDKSFKHLNEALRIDPTLAEGFYYRGYNYRELGSSEKAISNFLRTVELRPDHFEAYLQLGLLHAEKKDAKAEDYYSSALRLKPGSTRALYARGMYYQGMDSTRRAIGDYRQILEKDPRHKAATYNLGYNYYVQKQYDSSLYFFDKALVLDPIYAEAWYGKGLSLQAMGNEVEAKVAIAKYEDIKATEEQ